MEAVYCLYQMSAAVPPALPCASPLMEEAVCCWFQMSAAVPPVLPLHLIRPALQAGLLPRVAQFV